MKEGAREGQIETEERGGGWRGKRKEEREKETTKQHLRSAGKTSKTAIKWIGVLITKSNVRCKALLLLDETEVETLPQGKQVTSFQGHCLPAHNCVHLQLAQ